MADEYNSVPSVARTKPFILFRIWQWLVASIFAISALAMLPKIENLSLPGAPTVLFWIAMAVTVIVAVLHTTPVFFRLPPIGILAAYGSTLPALMLSGTAHEKIDAVYERTPEGAKQKAEREELAQVEADRDAKVASAAAEVQRVTNAAQAEADMREKVTACLSWGGRFGPLEEEIKANLHNPNAFEHVKTDVIGPTPDGDNLEITFRAENGFGALREGWARAKVNPDDCALLSVGRLNT